MINKLPCRTKIITIITLKLLQLNKLSIFKNLITTKKITIFLFIYSVR